MKIPNLDNVHVIFHHQLPELKWKEISIDEIEIFNVRGYTICKIYRGEELIGEGRADCSLDDNFNKAWGRGISCNRALKKSVNKLTLHEMKVICNHLNLLPSTLRTLARNETIIITY